jgi:hypothetical protein
MCNYSSAGEIKSCIQIGIEALLLDVIYITTQNTGDRFP